MAEQDQASRTEEATPRRREQAREEGQVVNSPDLQSALGLLSGAVVLTLGGEWLVSTMGSLTVHRLTALPTGDLTPLHVSRLGWSLVADLLRACLPLTLVVMGAGLFSAVGQAGSVQLVPLKLDWSRLDPRKGWERLASWESLVRGAMAVGKFALIAGIAVGIIVVSGPELAMVGFQSFATVCRNAWGACGRLMLMLSGVMLALGVADFGFKWFRHEQKMRMSRQELKDEQKQETGDPHLKALVRKRQREALQMKGLNQVHEATFVITNPTHLSIAMKYEPGVTTAPVVVAKGEGIIALRIRQLAAEHGVALLERKPLARAMYNLVDVGQEIPLEFYQAIAEILGAVYRLRGHR